MHLGIKTLELSQVPPATFYQESTAAGAAAASDQYDFNIIAITIEENHAAGHRSRMVQYPSGTVPAPT
jgi:hypothetical protein